MLCPHCGADNSDEARFCAACGAQLYSQTMAPAGPPEARPYAPLRTSGLAVASLILGVLAFLTCGATAIPGLILGIIAAVKINANRDRLTGQGFAVAGIAVSGTAIFLIPVMAAILFPVFAKAREAARRSTCQTNMKQLSQALKMYCDDYDGTLPSSVLVNGNLGDVADYQTFGCKLCADGKFEGPGVRKVTWSQVLYDSLRNKDGMWCPSDPTDHNPAGNPTVSYWYKYAMDRAWAPPINARKKTDYGYESDQIVFFEHADWHYGGREGLRIGSQVNASFMDTHVEKIAIGRSGPPEPVNTPAGATGPYEPFYYNFYTDPNGGEHDYSESGPLPVSVSTGVCVDPRSNYDSFY
jgi:hypothetical protein